MKILLALNSFKGSCSSIEANLALQKGLSRYLMKKNLTVFPLFDGGDGSVEGLHYHLKYKKKFVDTINALQKRIRTYYVYNEKEKTAYIEIAQASGIAQIGSEHNKILRANTCGSGILIKNAIQQGATNIILLIGGSATNDAGMGILSELGIKFISKSNKVLDPIPLSLKQIHRIDLSGYKYNNIKFEVWTDVNNPFTGPLGAVHIFSKQKGANPKDQIILEQGMIHLKEVIKNQSGLDLNEIKGAGAAGGIGGGLKGILDADLFQCTHRIIQLLNLETTIKAHDVVITGEGNLDNQSMYGKLVHGISQLSRKFNKPVIGLCGGHQLNTSQLNKLGMKAVFSIVPGPVNLGQALQNWKPNLIHMGNNLGALWQQQ